ncbi:MAG: P-II family nitrogen regulator [Patescibacteria group bacterium]
MSDCVMKFDLIITIVLKGFAEDAIEAARKAGAEGSTIIEGRGLGIHENAKILGMAIEPEKEIILTLIDRNKTQQVLDAIADAVGLNKPGKGIAVVLKVEEAIGICHLLNK